MRDISAEVPVDEWWEGEKCWQEVTERIKEEKGSERGVKELRWSGDQVRCGGRRWEANGKEFCQKILNM